MSLKSQACYNFIAKITELGELRLIELISSIIHSSQIGKAESQQKLILGIGDDCAVWRGNDSIELVTIDALVQDIHFTLDITSWADLGWKALAINLSDIAAMGGIPRYALVSLALPAQTEVNDVVLFYVSMIELANIYGVSIIGGDTDNTKHISATVTLLGEIGNQTDIITRSTAKPGDKIAITGHLGTAAAGLKMLTKKLNFENDSAAAFQQAFNRPIPRIKEGQILLQSGIRTGIDVSDGLISDLKRICRASRVGARLEIGKIPVHPKVQDAFSGEALILALSGGEDYELLFTGTQALVEQVKQQMDCPITIIGDITNENTGNVTLVNDDNDVIIMDEEGWQHFICK